MAAKGVFCVLFVSFFALASATYCTWDIECNKHSGETCCSDGICRETCYYCNFDSNCGTGEVCCDGDCKSSCTNVGAVAAAIVSTIVFCAIIGSIVACFCCACCPYYRYRSPGTVIVAQPGYQPYVNTTHTTVATQHQHYPPPANYNQPPPPGYNQPPPPGYNQPPSPGYNQPPPPGYNQPPPPYPNYPQPQAQGQGPMPPQVSAGQPVKYRCLTCRTQTFHSSSLHSGKQFLVGIYGGPVRVLPVGSHPVQILLIRSDWVRILLIRSDPIRSGPIQILSTPYYGPYCVGIQILPRWRIMASKGVFCVLFFCFFALGSATYCYYDSDCETWSESCCSDNVCRETCGYCSYDYQCGTGEVCCDGDCQSSCSTPGRYSSSSFPLYDYCSYDNQCGIGEVCCDGDCQGSCPVNGGAIAGGIVAVVGMIVLFVIIALARRYRYRSPRTVIVAQPGYQPFVNSTTSHTTVATQQQHYPPPANYNQPPPPGYNQPPPPGYNQPPPPGHNQPPPPYPDYPQPQAQGQTPMPPPVSAGQPVKF
ncbi:uncharacterized protein LOC144637588 [Oculina patagonica]